MIFHPLKQNGMGVAGSFIIIIITHFVVAQKVGRLLKICHLAADVGLVHLNKRCFGPTPDHCSLS